MPRTIKWRRRAALAMSVWLCLLSVACAENATTATASHPPPPSVFDWDYSASVGATTPQEAYTRSAHFVPCRMTNDDMRPSADQSVTWLVSGTKMGVAYLRATCRNAFHGNYLFRSFLVLFKGRQNTWYIDEFHQHVPFSPTEDPIPIPETHAQSLTDLFPADAYFDWGPVRPPSVPVSWVGRAWFSLTPRDYVLGLVTESVTRPQEATTTTVDGLPGWVMEANGMATIVAARPDGALVVFAGTGSATSLAAFATHALPRADDMLRDPPQGAISPTPGA